MATKLDTMSIESMMVNPGPDVFYTKEFMDCLEAHVSYFRTSRNSSIIQIDPGRALVYVGDLYGYLNEVGIDMAYHWFIMRINYMTSNTDFNETVTQLIVPNKNDINKIRTSFASTSTIKL